MTTAGTDEPPEIAETPPDAGDAEPFGLVAFLHERDAPCPLCGYNLRNLTGATCPECRQPLHLTVGVRDLRLGWFLFAIAPGIFSGIAATLLLVPIVVSPFTGNGSAPWQIVALDVFGFASGLAALLLIARRPQFLGLGRRAQIGIALGAWLVHAGALALFMASSI